MIELKNLSKSYNKGKVKAVNNLSLTVQPGEIFGFLGPNGAGKTTTIKMIVGLLKPDKGSIMLNGLCNQEHALKCKSMIAYIPEDPEIYDRLTGLEYINFIGDVYGTPAKVRTTLTEKWSEIFGLTNAIKQSIKSYSHGMRQKIILIGAIIARPEIFILDEPLTGLDPKSAHSLKEIMHEHCKQGKTLFFSTHIMEVAEKLCDRIGIINNGELIACGTMDELKHMSKNSESLENIFLEITEK